MRKFILVVLATILVILFNTAVAVTVEDFSGTWDALTLSMGGESIDAKELGFDMRTVINGTQVTLSSEIMGIPITTYDFSYDDGLYYSEDALTNISITKNDDETLNLNLLTNGMDIDFTMIPSIDGLHDMTLITKNGLYEFKFVKAKAVKHSGDKFIGLYIEFTNNSSESISLINAIPYPWVYQDGTKLDTYGSTHSIKGVSQNPEVAPGKTAMGVILYYQQDDSPIEVKMDNGYRLTLELSND